MWLQAVLTADDLMHVLHELTPMRIQLDSDDPARVLHLDPPAEVKFRDGEGALITTSATLQWDVVGIKVPVVLRAVEVLLIPSIEVDARGADQLALQARVERLDLSALPGFVEDKLQGRINQALENPSAFVRWGFTRTLDFHFHLPAMVQPVRDLRLAARWGALRVSEQGFAMAASFGFLADLEEAKPAPTPPA
jgi:hypothetical protein